MEIKWKSVGLWGSYGLKQGNPLAIVQKTHPNCICFVYFSIFDLLYQRGYQRQYFRTLHLKVLAYETAMAWNRGIPGKILNFLIKLYLVLLNGSKCYQRWDLLKLNEYLGLQGRYSLKQGNPLYFYQNTNPIIFVMFIPLFFDLLYQRGSQW